MLVEESCNLLQREVLLLTGTGGPYYSVLIKPTRLF